MKNLKITNYMSHKDTDIEFSPGLNVFEGKSRQGKTAIVRSLRWLFANYPRGKWFFRHGETKCKVQGEMENGTIARFRNSTDNAYKVDGAEYSNLKSGIPEEVSQFIAMKSLNWQFEHDGPFLLNDTSGEVAKRLNEITDLEVIDKSSFNLAKWIKQNKTHKDAAESMIEDLETDLKSYDYLDDMEKELKHIEKAQNVLEKSEQIITVLDEAVDELSEIEKALSKAGKTASARKPFTEIEDRSKELSVKENKIYWFERAVEGCESVDRQIKEIAKIAESRQQYNELTRKYGGLQAKSAIVRDLADGIEDVERTDNKLKQKKRELKELKEQLPETCPYCGAPL